MLIIFFGLFAGILLSSLIFCDIIQFYIGIGFFALILIIMFIRFGFNKRMKLLLISFIIGVVSCSISLISNVLTPTFSGEVVISGRVLETSVYYEKSMTVVLDNVKANDESISNIKVYVKDDFNTFEKITPDMVLTFSAELEKIVFTDNFSSSLSNLSEGIEYTCNVDYSKIEFLGVDSSVRTEIKNKVYSNLTPLGKFADFAFSSLFGDKSGLSIQSKDIFNIAGIAHILAVSGLHISIVYGILIFILDKLRLKEIIKFFIIAFALLFYAYLCSFTPSVLRASIMCLVLLLARITKRQYDSLSALCFAGILIVLFSPFTIFNYSFILSFASVFGILSLNKSIFRALNFVLPSKVANVISLSMSAYLGVLVGLIYGFGNIQILSILVNVLVVPIFTICFGFIFVTTLISLIIPVVSTILIIAKPVLALIEYVCVVVSTIPFAVIQTSSVSFIIMVLYTAMIILISKFSNIYKDFKWVILDIYMVLFCISVIYF